MKLSIKNMVCPRCITAVEQVLSSSGIAYNEVRLGEVELKKDISKEKITGLRNKLENLGFELLDDTRHKLIEQVKSLLIQAVQSGSIEEHFSISEYISKATHKEYSSVSKLFSQVESMTIEQYFILQKIEKVKELLVYGEKTLSEIAWDLGYSNVSHLSAQFKQIIGLAPTQFRKLEGNHRTSIDAISRQ
jgi:AraC family transcriptional regulator